MVSGSITATGQIDGENGYNTSVVQLFRRYTPTQVSPLPALPIGTLTYTFSTGVLSGTTASFNGWSQQIPDVSGGEKLYVTQAIATSQDVTDEIASSDWSTPVEYVADGLNSAPVFIYKRLANQPTDKPANGAVYTFSTGALTGTLNGWSTSIPATDNNHHPCWVRQAMAVSNENTDIINASEWSNPATKLVEDGSNGQNVVRIDIDNENDSIQYQGDGKTKIGGSVSTTAYLYEGANDKSNDVAFSVDTSNTNIDSSNYSLSGRVLTVSALHTSNHTAQDGYITLQCTYGGVTYKAKFTVKALINQDKFDLDVNPNSLSLNTDDGWSASKTITIKVMRTPAGGGTPTAVNPSTYGLAVAASIGTLSSYNSSINSFTLTITQTQATNNANTVIDIHDTNDSSKVYDRETVPFNKSENGDDNFVCLLDTYSVVVETDRTNKIKNNVQFFIGLKATYGQTDVLSACTITADTTDGDIDLYVRSAGTSNAYVEARLYQGIGLGATNSITVTFTHPTYGTRQQVCKITRVVEGEQGHTGATGPMYYPAGEYDNNTEYTRDANVCPMVHYSDANGGDLGYWYLVADTNVSGGTHIAPGNTPTSLAIWHKADDFGMVITEALFTRFASLGSFIVSQDFFISQFGTLFSAVDTPIGVTGNETTREQGKVYLKSVTIMGVSRDVPYYAATNNPNADKPCYTYFKDDDPMAKGVGTSTFPKFRPMLVINARTGEEWHAGGNVYISSNGDVYIKGNGDFTGKITANDGEIGGFQIDSDKIKSLVAADKSLTLNKDGSFTIINGTNSVKMNTDGFEVMFGGEGFRVGNFGTGHQGMERWDSVRNVWAAMYERKIAHINETATTVNLGNLPGVNYVLNARQDSDNWTLVLLPPVDNVPDGTSIIVRGLTLYCSATVKVANTDTDAILIGDYKVTDVAIENADCAEFIMCKNIGGAQGSGKQFVFKNKDSIGYITATVKNAWICNFYDRDV